MAWDAWGEESRQRPKTPIQKRDILILAFVAAVIVFVPVYYLLAGYR